MGDMRNESSRDTKSRPLGYPARAGLRIVLIYAVFASLWILLSDTAVEWLISDTARRTSISMMKGWMFVAVTSLLLYGLIQRLLDRIRSILRSEQIAQEEHSRSQALFRSIVDSSPDAIFAKDFAGRYILANREWLRITGKSADQTLVHTDVDVFPQQADTIVTNDRSVIANDRIDRFQEHISTVDGERIYSSIKGPLHDGNAIIGMFGIARDITDRKRTEAHLAKLSLAIEQSSERSSSPLPKQKSKT